jgi:arylsulfatase A-like enzyme
MVLLLLTGFSPAIEAETRPNLLLIIADDLGYTDLGAYGSEIPTPTLDDLAYRGIRLTNFHTGEACQQTRSMLMASRGLTSAIDRLPRLPSGERANALRQDIATLPELLRDAGYRTYMSGKWDLGLADHQAPMARGFDRSFVLLQASASHFARHFWDEESWYREDDRPISIEDLPEDFYSTRAYTDKILEYLDEHDDSAPWFGYVTYTAPHWPLQVPDNWLDRHAGRYDEGYDVLRANRARRATEKGVIPDGASLEGFESTTTPWDELSPRLQSRYARSQEIYASMIELLDEEIGRLVDYLSDSGQLDNTVILFMSDHGASAAEIGIMEGPSSMPPHFNPVIDRHDNSDDNIGRASSFVDHGTGFGEASTAPLRHYKGTLSEGGIRAAAFIHYPAAIEQPSINHTFITVMDVLPTFLELAGTRHPGAGPYNGRQIQSIIGRSFWASVTSEASTVHGDDNAAGWSRNGLGAIIRGRYKLTNQPSPRESFVATELPWRLYDIESDPGERIDIAGQNPDLVEELLGEWRKDWQ